MAIGTSVITPIFYKKRFSSIYFEKVTYIRHDRIEKDHPAKYARFFDRGWYAAQDALAGA